jgi:two-component system alkaline phosphatase synthesis response regulator PhoP
MPKNKKKILLVEDEIEMARMYKDKFKEAGYDIILALTAQEGIKKAKKERPDLILLDILLPTDNGITFLEKLRKHKDKKLAQARVVALSNYDEPQAKKRALELGAENYLIKTSFTPKQLVEEIKKYLPC